jgi:hypothetical protein
VFADHHPKPTSNQKLPAFNFCAEHAIGGVEVPRLGDEREKHNGHDDNDIEDG